VSETRDVRLWLDDELENLGLVRVFPVRLSSVAELAAIARWRSVGRWGI